MLSMQPYFINEYTYIHIFISDVLNIRILYVNFQEKSGSSFSAYRKITISDLSYLIVIVESNSLTNNDDSLICVNLADILYTFLPKLNYNLRLKFPTLR